MLQKHQDLVTAIKMHAMKNYENGWDFIIEAMDDEEILEELFEWNITLTIGEAIKYFTTIADVRTEQLLNTEPDVENYCPDVDGPSGRW